MYNCACSCDMDYETAAVCNTKTVKARKAHKCCECGSTIEPNDTYERTKGLWDGYWEEYKTCSICARIRKDMCPCWIYGQLWEDLWESNGLLPHEPPGKDEDDKRWWGG